MSQISTIINHNALQDFCQKSGCQQNCEGNALGCKTCVKACPSGPTIQMISMKKTKHLELSDSIWIFHEHRFFFEHSHVILHLAMISLLFLQEHKAKHPPSI